MRTWCSWGVHRWRTRPCWLRRGHVWEVQFQVRRIWLACDRCPKTTAGWDLPGPSPRAIPPHTRTGRIRWWTLKVRHAARGW